MKKSIKEKFSNLLKNQRFAVIATQDKNEPYTNLVSFLVSNDFKKIYFPTSKKTKKFQNLSANSKISILIDNRGNRPIDVKNAMVVSGTGITKEIKENKVNNEFLKKHPYLKNFINSSNSVMIEISIEKYIIVDNFENVTIFIPRGINDTIRKNQEIE
jgi:general stress protein 26